MNKTILMGRLTKDPEVKYFQNENSTAMARYTLTLFEELLKKSVKSILGRHFWGRNNPKITHRFFR